MAAPEKYAYDAYVVRVIDGDTIEVNIDLGMWTWSHGIVLRMAGINMPEMNSTDGWFAARKLETLVLERSSVRIRTTKTKSRKETRDKYGRLLAEVWAGDLNVNEAMQQWWEARKNERA